MEGDKSEKNTEAAFFVPSLLWREGSLKHMLEDLMRMKKQVF
jgi:hypothetical protein